MNGADDDCCPICFSEYTLDTIHRPTALKCGHIFGNQCILNWCKKKGTLLCPTCFTKSRKTDIRILYGTSLRVYEDNRQNEILQKFLDLKNENEMMKQEILHYKTSIDYYQAEIKRLEEMRNEPCEINKPETADVENSEYVFRHKIIDKNTHCTVINEQNTNKIIYTARTMDSVGYKILDLYSLEIKYIRVFEKVSTHSFASDMKMSPFNDGLMLISYNKTIKLINIITNNDLTNITLDSCVVSVTFNNIDRTVIYFICNLGYVYSYDLISLKIIHKVFLAKNLLSVVAFYSSIYVYNVFEWFCVSTTDYKITKVETPENYKCCHIFANTEDLLCTLKDKDAKTLHFYCNIPKADKKNNIKKYLEEEDNTHAFNTLLSREVQIVKSKDKIFEKKAYIKNEAKNTIEVYCLQNLVNLRTYKFDDKILDFDVTQKIISVITSNNIVIYQRCTNR